MCSVKNLNSILFTMDILKGSGTNIILYKRQINFSISYSFPVKIQMVRRVGIPKNLNINPVTKQKNQKPKQIAQTKILLSKKQ